MLRKVLAAMVALALCTAASGAMAGDPLFVGDTISFVKTAGTLSGGEYLVYKNGVPLFTTFCVQTSELLSTSPASDPGRWPFVVGNISTEIVLAGAKALDYKTAYLYTQFRDGLLTDYTGSDADSNALQNAMWHAEGLAPLSPGKATIWYDEAVNAGWVNTGMVRVVNLMQTNGVSHAQDVLMITGYVPPPPVPEPMSMALVTVGLGAVAGLRRRSRS